MKTKREVLKQFAEKGYCAGINCSDCSYQEICGVANRLTIKTRLQKIGAMAILRMFRKKKKPLLENGTKIKFSDGRIAVIKTINALHYLEIDEEIHPIGLLVSSIWEVIE